LRDVIVAGLAIGGLRVVDVGLRGRGAGTVRDGEFDGALERDGLGEGDGLQRESNDREGQQVSDAGTGKIGTATVAHHVTFRHRVLKQRRNSDCSASVEMLAGMGWEAVGSNYEPTRRRAALAWPKSRARERAARYSWAAPERSPCFSR